MPFDATPPPIWVPPKPAIIQRAPLEWVRFGMSYAVSRVGRDVFALPRDFRDATVAEIRRYMPVDFSLLPDWCIQSLLLVGGRGGGGAGTRDVDFITSTNAANQSYSVAADFNPDDNTVELISHAGTAAAGTTTPESEGGANDDSAQGGGGGGGGGYAKADNVGLTPGGNATFRLRAAGAGSTDGAADWFNGTTLGGSSVGIRGGANGSSEAGQSFGGSGASVTNAIGSVKRAGGDGAAGTVTGNENGNVRGGGGGGAAGPAGVGGDASGQTGGTGDGGATAQGADGEQYDADHGAGGGGDGGATGNNAGQAAGEYGASGGGGGAGGGNGAAAGASRSGLIVVTNNASVT